MAPYTFDLNAHNAHLILEALQKRSPEFPVALHEAIRKYLCQTDALPTNFDASEP